MSRPIDLLIASHMHFISGGAEGALLEQIKYLASQDVRMHVVVGAEGEFASKIRSLRIDCSVIPMPWWVRAPHDETPYNFRTGVSSYNGLHLLISLLQSIKPRLCMTNTIVNPWLAYAAAATGTRHVWFIHEIGTAGLGLRYYLGEAQTFRTIDVLSEGFFFNSQITAEAYTHILHPSKNLGVVYPGGMPPLPGNLPNPYSEEAFCLISVGQIKPQKGQFTTVKAVHHLVKKGEDIELLLIGGFEDQDYLEQIQSYIKANDLAERIKLLGQQENPSSYVQYADVSIMSALNEAFGRVTVEAMMLGKPVIGADSGGTTEIINNGKDGLLYTPNDHLDLAEKILSLLKNSSYLTTLSEAAKASSFERFSDNTRFSEFLSYLRTLDPASKPKSSLDLSLLLPLVEDYDSLIGKPTLLSNKLVGSLRRTAKHFLTTLGIYRDK